MHVSHLFVQVTRLRDLTRLCDAKDLDTQPYLKGSDLSAAIRGLSALAGELSCRVLVFSVAI